MAPPPPFADWPSELREELEQRSTSPAVGTRLLLEDEYARHWEIRLAPGERIGFHRHVLDYVWTCVTGGAAVSHTGNGETLDVSYAVGETRRLSFGPGEWMVHDLVNVGDADLIFTTVEYLRSANDALPLGAERAAA
jgi:beta-alanine degradation protein BauB